MLREDLQIGGRLTLRKVTPDGQCIEEMTVHNDITQAGRKLVARLFNTKESNATQRVSKIKVGTSNTIFTPQQTALTDPDSFETDILTAEIVVPDADSTRAMLRLTGELGEADADGKQLHEAGLFTADGVMYNRVTFPTITKSAEFKLTLVWEITF